MTQRPYQQPPGWQAPQHRPPQKSHTARNVLLIIAGSLLALIVIGLIGAALQKTPAATAASTHSPSASAAATPTKNAAAKTNAPSKPAPPLRPKVLLRFSGSGIGNSHPFLVTQSTLAVRYRFSCTSFGQAGNFAADLETGNQASLNSDDQSVADALAMHGAATTDVYPQDTGSYYHISVDSECSWTVVVSAP